MSGDEVFVSALKTLERGNSNVPLTNKIYDLAKAKIVILYPLPRGEREGAEGAAQSPLPLWERMKNRQLSPKG